MNDIKAVTKRQSCEYHEIKFDYDATNKLISEVINIIEVVCDVLPISKNAACCPFHEEKTPSFKVNPLKNTYKCFGCGKGGDTIQFVIEYYNKTYAEALLFLCNKYGKDPVPLRTDLDTDNYKKEQNEKRVMVERQQSLSIKFQKELFTVEGEKALSYLINTRCLSVETIKDWELGFDNYRKAITIPLYNEYGGLVGLSVRFLSNSFEGRKYNNPKESLLYSKSSYLFGLYQAVTSRSLVKAKFCVIVEGYFDLLACVCLDLLNVISISGTAISEQQILKIKKHVTHVVFMLDCDDSGIKSAMKNINKFLLHGFKVELVKLPDGKDPEEFIRILRENKTEAEVKKYLLSLPEDAIKWKARTLWFRANSEPYEVSRTITEIVDTLCCISNDVIREIYTENIQTELKIKNHVLSKELTKTIEKTQTSKKPTQAGGSKFLLSRLTEQQEPEFLAKGYITVNQREFDKPIVGFYTLGYLEITNFIVTPLFHIYAGLESRYMVSLYNGYRDVVIDVPAKVITSVDMFQSMAVSEGNFIIFGNKQQWLRIASELLQKFPRCMEINFLGWQPYGFFAYVDKVYIPGEGLKDLNKWGIINHKDENFLVPASCEAYRQLQRSGDDPFENDRYLTYKETQINLSTWAKQMQKVYLQKGIVGIAYVVLAIFRDIVFEVDNNCPHLYGFGEPSSGKSKWAESITSVFYFKRSAFNLNSGTDFAFFHYMQAFPNCPAHLNEFEIEVMKPEWFQAIKGVYDGEGRERGKGGSKNKTEVMRVRSPLILTGQKLVIADDNSLVSRSLIEPFSIRENTEEEVRAYSTLKEWESVGLSGLLPQILQYRNYFKLEYKNQLNYQLSTWRKQKKDVTEINQRVLQNYCHLATCYNLLSHHIDLPQSAEEFTEYCYQQALKWSQFIHSTDTLSEFWRTVEFLTNGNQMVPGWDFIVESVAQFKVRVKDREELKSFPIPTKVLFLRLNNAHKLFQTAYRSRTGKEAMSMDNLMHYFGSRKYFLGSVKQKYFSRIVTADKCINNTIQTGKKEEKKITSCYAFNYTDLGIDMEIFDSNG